MLNKNSLAVKKCEANQCYKRPKTLISSKAKKLNRITKTPFTCNTIVYRIFSQLYDWLCHLTTLVPLLNNL